MDAGSTWFNRELGKRLAEAVERGDLSLASGNATSFDDYRYRVGFQNALRQVQAMCEDIASEQDKRKAEVR